VSPGGHADNSIRIISADGAKTLETAVGHCAPVTCLALSSDSSYLVTGSRDTTVLLWRIHRMVTSLSANVSEAPSTPTSTSSNALANIIADKSRRRHIEGPIHVLQGHLREVLCCCVSSDLGIVVSCSQSSDVLLHSIRRGRLIRRLIGVEAHAVCLSSDGIIMAWNETLCTLSTFTVNGIVVASVELPFSGSISCMEVSFDGHTALVGINSCSEEGSFGTNRSWQSKQQGNETLSTGSNEKLDKCRLDVPSPSICFLDLYTLKVLKNFFLLQLSLLCLQVHIDFLCSLLFNQYSGGF